MTIYDKIRKICRLDNCGIDEDGNLEWMGTDVQWQKSADMIEKYEDGDLSDEEIEETWKSINEDLPEDKINLPNN